MSEDYKIIAVGGGEFVLPYSLAGLQVRQEDKITRDSESFKEEEFKNTVYLVDENAVKDTEFLREKEEEGANITLLKAWGRSETAENKIKKASVKAMGVDLLEE